MTCLNNTNVFIQFSIAWGDEQENALLLHKYAENIL